MSSRRRSPRFVLPQPVSGELHVLEHIRILWHRGSEVSVLSLRAARSGEEMALEFPVADGPSVAVRVVQSAPHPVDGVLRHDLRLQVLVGDDATFPVNGNGTRGPATPGELSMRHGTLIRPVPVRLLNFSAAGYLLESDACVEQGAVGDLRVQDNGRTYCEYVRVSWTSMRPGICCRSGAELLPTRRGERRLGDAIGAWYEGARKVRSGRGRQAVRVGETTRGSEETNV